MGQLLHLTPPPASTATTTQWWTRHANKFGLPWVEHYWNDWEAPHRQQIVLAVGIAPASGSIYEIGCNSGPNLRLIRRYLPGMRLGGLEMVPVAATYAQEHLGVPIDCGILPDDLPDSPWDIVLSCYTLAYLDPEDAQITMRKMSQMAQQALIIVEPFPSPGSPVGQCRHDGLPEWRHDYESTFGALGWQVMWKWPLIPPVQHTNAVLVLLKAPSGLTVQ